jgi:glycine cleavage system regulatory protein
VTQTSIILTLIGPDRPGLVRLLAELVAERGGSWLESRMARLAGQFAGVVRIAVPALAAAPLIAALEGLADHGLRVSLEVAAAEEARPPQAGFVLEVVGNDRPGIVRDFTRALSACGVNIEELTTDVLSGSFSGETLFRATARLCGPSADAAVRVRAALEHLGNELMVDIRPVA